MDKDGLTLRKREADRGLFGAAWRAIGKACPFSGFAQGHAPMRTTVAREEGKALLFWQGWPARMEYPGDLSRRRGYGPAGRPSPMRLPVRGPRWVQSGRRNGTPYSFNGAANGAIGWIGRIANSPHRPPRGCIRTARINDAEWQSEPFRRIAHQVVKPAQPMCLSACGRDGCSLAGGTARRTLSMGWQTARLVGLDVSRTRRTDLHAGAYGRRGLTASNGRIGFAFRSECGNRNTEARGRFLRHAESGILPADVVGKASAISYNVIYKGRPRMDFPSWRGWLRPAPLFSCAFFRQIAPEGKTVCISILPSGFGVDGCKPAFIIHNYGRRRDMSSEMINENWTQEQHKDTASKAWTGGTQ